MNRLSAEAKKVFASLPEPGVMESLRDLVRPRSLECVQVEVSSRCVGKCSYCPHTVNAQSWKSRDMSLETYALLWPALRCAERVHLQGWGEPFLNPHFFDFAELARRAGCRVSTTTCGMVMDEGMAEKIVESGIDVVAFSLSGTDSATGSARAGISFEKLDKSVRLLQAVRKKRVAVHLEIHIAYMLLASQVQAIRCLPELMEKWSAHAAVVSTMDYIPSMELASEAFLPHQREKIEAARVMLRQAGERIRASGREFYSSLPAEKPTGGCRERAHKTVYVDAEGTLSPCVYLNVPAEEQARTRVAFGSIREKSILEILSGAECRAFRAGTQSTHPPEACLACPKRFEVFCS
ncbi:MAG: radical SAM protein [Mailhella sp.]|nr:radical SAM protein [Mailhella sp.]